MEVTEDNVSANGELPTTSKTTNVNASQTKIAQKTWEISNFIQGNCF